MSQRIRKTIAALILLAIAGVAMAQVARSRPPSPRLTLPRDLPPASGFGLEDAFGDLRFRGPLGIVSQPGVKDAVFIVERGGRIMCVTDLDDKPKSQVFFNLLDVLKSKGTDTLVTDGECGLLGLAFHPNFRTNGYFYVAYSLGTQEGGATKLYNRLSRFSAAPRRLTVDPDSELPMITQLDPSPNHNGGDLHFGADGHLYYSMGDGGTDGDKAGNGGRIDRDFFSAIFRLDVDQGKGSLPPNAHSQDSQRFPSAVHPGAYAVPRDNPFVGTVSHRGVVVDPAKVRTEIFATGLRNPWRMSFDRPTGRLFVGDVGGGELEEIDIIKVGGDYGWSKMEGSRTRVRGVDANTLTCLPPIFEYGRRGEISGSSITGGLVYRGTRLPELQGAYLFADFTSRRVMAIRDIGGKWTPTLLAIDGSFVAMGEDPRNGDVLMADLGAGRIRRLVRLDPKAVRIPQRLSEVAAFADLATRKPAAGFVPYTPNVSFWSDYAVKSRWIAVPDNGRITFNIDRNWGFPNGTVWMKHFDLDLRRGDPTSRKPIETRFLVKTGSGAYGLTYQWRDDGSDANLVGGEGADRTMNVTIDGRPAKQVWRYPSRSDCLACHTEQSGYALGFNTRQLNCPGEADAKTHQIQSLSDSGYFNQPVPDVKALPKFVNLTDDTQPLEQRARAYLAVNCAQCHQPGGTGLGRFDLRPTTSLSSTNLINGPLLKDGGDPLRRLVIPGDPAKSMLVLRMQGHGGRMPPVGSNETDLQGVRLISDWIRQLGPEAGPRRP